MLIVASGRRTLVNLPREVERVDLETRVRTAPEPPLSQQPVQVRNRPLVGTVVALNVIF